MDKTFASFLPYVQKPGRYTNEELNAQHKDWNSTLIKVVLAFPDVYDVGMGHLGYKILYSLINSREDALAERVYSPWIDLGNLMEENHIPLTSLESGSKLIDFDLVGFTLQYELSYTNILKILDLAGISRRSIDRKETDPLIMAGGPCAFNVEPIADFFDFVVLGEGEEVLEEILDLVNAHKTRNSSRNELLKELAQLKGVYVPSFYEPIYEANGDFVELKPLNDNLPMVITKRVVKDFNASYFPDNFIVPFVEVVHDRTMVEVMRGCTRGCRFCQAGMIYRPVREREPEILKEQISKIADNTGYEEISLSSLSSGDYSQIKPLLQDLILEYQSCGVTVSLPSLRIDSFSMDLAKQIQKVRKTGLTFAPEAGTQRLRDVINKNVSEKDLKDVVRGAFEAGWHAIKLYFMIGLPTESEEDLDGIINLAHEVIAWGREYGTAKRLPQVSISVASFVPKPHTPFQWMGQESMDSLHKKQKYLRDKLRHPGIRFSYPHVEESFLEAVFSRGDRRLSKVIEKAVDLGCQFDSWSDQLRFDLWLQAFKNCDVDPHYYANRTRSFSEQLPWSHLSSGLHYDFLLNEWKLAIEGSVTEDCRWDKCTNCGVCPNLGVRIQLAEAKKHE